MKILIVDDDARMRTMVREVAASPKREFFEASTAEEALAVCHALSPEVVIMDIELGGTDGLAATRSILQLHPAAKVIVLTAHNTPAFLEAAKKAGAAEFLGKEYLLQLRTMLAAYDGS